jgi:hypothetical protein
MTCGNSRIIRKAMAVSLVQNSTVVSNGNTTLPHSLPGCSWFAPSGRVDVLSSRQEKVSSARNIEIKYLPLPVGARLSAFRNARRLTYI